MRGTINLAHNELRIEDKEYFQRFFRMRIELFEHLVEKVAPYIFNGKIQIWENVYHLNGVSITLRLLATGESYRSLEYSTRIPACTISRIIPETCRVICEVLKNNYLQVNYILILNLIIII